MPRSGASGGRRQTSFVDRPVGLAGALVSAVQRCAEWTGGLLRTVARRPLDPSADRRLGFALLAGVVIVVAAGPLAGVLVAAVTLAGPAARDRSARRRRARSIAAQIPDVIDLFRLAVDAGIEIAPALWLVAEHVDDGEVGRALGRVCNRVGRGDAMVDAVAELGSLGEPARAVHEALVSTLRQGVPLAAALDRAGRDARDVRRRHHEEAARTLPVKLLFPLVFCTLPALGALTVLPVLLRAFPTSAP